MNDGIIVVAVRARPFSIFELHLPKAGLECGARGRGGREVSDSAPPLRLLVVDTWPGHLDHARYARASNELLPSATPPGTSFAQRAWPVVSCVFGRDIMLGGLVSPSHLSSCRHWEPRNRRSAASSDPSETTSPHHQLDKGGTEVRSHGLVTSGLCVGMGHALSQSHKKRSGLSARARHTSSDSRHGLRPRAPTQSQRRHTERRT